MLGKYFIPDAYWEHYPLIESNSSSGILVDASILSIQNEPVLLLALNDVIEFSIKIGTTTYIEADATVTTADFGEYRTLKAVFPDSTIIQLVFHIPKLVGLSFTSVDGIEFSQHSISTDSISVSSINTLIKDLVLDTGEINANVEGNVLTLSLSVNCDDTPCAAPSLKSVSGVSSDSNLNLFGVGYRITGNELTPGDVNIFNLLGSCCDCDEQFPVSEAGVESAQYLAEVIENLKIVKDLYDELLTKVDLKIAETSGTDACNRWQYIKSTYLPSTLFVEKP